jgi:hypothetical protein
MTTMLMTLMVKRFKHKNKLISISATEIRLLPCKKVGQENSNKLRRKDKKRKGDKIN